MSLTMQHQAIMLIISAWQDLESAESELLMLRNRRGVEVKALKKELSDSEIEAQTLLMRVMYLSWIACDW